MKKIFTKCSLVLMILAVVTICFSGCSKKVTYTVTFDSMGGTVIDSQVVKEGESATKPKDPQKEGFTFVEWQLDNSTYDFSSPVTQNLTLSAFYTINEGVETVTIAYNADNDSGITTVKIAKGASTTAPPMPTKLGYKFIGWFLNDSKFDFSTNITENLLLVAKWEVDKNATNESKPNSNKANSNNKGSSSTNTNTSSASNVKNHTINFADVEGIWYVEGHDDASLKFSIFNGTWISLDAKGFDYYTCELEANSGRGDSAVYFYDNGSFYSEEITLEGKTKLIFSKNNKSVTFYRQKNYPSEKLWPHEQLLKDIDGYYWYLDGYEYTYLHPNVIPWYDHECLDWESKNLYITRDKFVAYEKLEPTKYWEYENDLGASSTTHNNLLVNPIEFADSLIEEYNMYVAANKLYMTVGGKEYTFTRYTSPKSVEVKLKLGFTEAKAKVGERIFLPVEIEPFWTYHQIEVLEDSSDNYAVAYHDRHYTSASYPYGSGANSNNGKTTLIFYAQSVGERTLNIRVKGMQKTYQLKITVQPEKATGISLNKSEVTLNKGDSETIVATVLPSNASNKNVTWSSSNSDVATVSSSGKITAKKYGETIITATTADGGYKATCKVIVNQSPLTVKASIAMETRFTDSSIKSGVSVTINASGGSENYVAYSIKLYRNGTYIGEVSEKQMFVTPFMNGTYTAEIYVKDSSGNEARNTQTTTIQVS